MNMDYVPAPFYFRMEPLGVRNHLNWRILTSYVKSSLARNKWKGDYSTLNDIFRPASKDVSFCG